MWGQKFDVVSAQNPEPAELEAYLELVEHNSSAHGTRTSSRWSANRATNAVRADDSKYVLVRWSTPCPAHNPEIFSDL